MPETVVCVASIVMHESKVLLVRQAKGHSLAGQWTIPWGRLDRGESPAAAAVREVAEESRVVAQIEGFLGIQELPSPWLGWFALVYQCSHVNGEPTPDGRETDAAMYVSVNELNALAEPIEPWSEWFVRQVFSGKTRLIRRSDDANPFGESAGFL